jgi:hypothetical protein
MLVTQVLILLFLCQLIAKSVAVFLNTGLRSHPQRPSPRIVSPGHIDGYVYTSPYYDAYVLVLLCVLW